MNASEKVLAPPLKRRSGKKGALIGRIVGVVSPGQAVVHVPDLGSRRRTARSSVALTSDDVGAEVVILLERGSRLRPIILARLQPVEPDCKENSALSEHAPNTPRPTVDGLPPETLVLEAGREITLRCGQASITLTRAGKVLIQGAYVSSRSTGTQRIRGASVQIN